MSQSFVASPRRELRVFAVTITTEETSGNISAAPISLPEGSWKQVAGGVTAAKGFKAAGMYAGLRASGKKPDLALVTCDVDAVAAGPNASYVDESSNYLKKAGDVHGTVTIDLSVGEGAATGKAWGCDLSYDYVKINAEYTS